MQIKPNRLVFQEKPGEIDKPLSPKENLKDLKGQVQENNSLAYQRLLVLESFRRAVRDRLWSPGVEQPVNFEGNDLFGSEVYANPNFQYIYEQLDEFFRQNTSEKYPINLQKEWMNKVVEWIVSWLQGHSFDVIPLTRENIDAGMLGLRRSNTSSKYKVNILYSPGSFSEWLRANYPDEYKSLF